MFSSKRFGLEIKIIRKIIMIVLMSIIFITKLFFATSLKVELNSRNCFYMRYMYSVFYANSNITADRLRSYADELQSNYGEIILAILDELREKEPSIDVYALMKINLYLNNVFGTLMVKPYTSSETTEDVNKDEVYRREFNIVHNDVLAGLRSRIVKNCFNKYVVFQQDVCHFDIKLNDPKYKDLNFLLPKGSWDIFWSRKDLAINHLEDSNLKLKYMLKPIMQRGTYWNLHPKKMLFYDMLSTNGPKSNNTSSEDSDPIDVLREVTLQSTLNNGKPVNIGIVFEIIQRYFFTMCVRAFQQQVLAATVHPLLHLVCTYLMFIKRVYYLDMDKDETLTVKMFKSSIENMGASILNIFDKFIRLELLPKKIQTHLTITYEEMHRLVHFTDKLSLRIDKPRWIELLYYRCSQPMKHNKLRFETDVESWQMDKNNTETIMNNIDRVEKYIEALSNQKIHYDIVVNKIIFFSHDDMFENVPECDIVYLNLNLY